MQAETVAKPTTQAACQTTGNNDECVGKFIGGLAAVLICCAVLYFTYATFWVKFSRAEVFFAECAREMIARNNMITPLYHNKPFFDKPILVYWLIVSTFKALGINHFVARIPSIVAGLASVALTAFATRALATSQKNAAALVSAMIVGSSFMFFSFAYLCMSDMFLVMFDISTLMLLYAGAQKTEKRDLLWWLAAVSMGFAFVTKGPIGIVLPAVSFLGYLFATKQLGLVRPRHVLLGGLSAALIAVPWFYAAYKANGTWALAYFFIRENFQRYAGSTYDTHKPIWFMVQSLMQGFLPWSILLIPAAGTLKKDWSDKFASKESKDRLYLWLWTATVTAFFSLSRGKCDYYVLPVYPAVAALVALHLTQNQTSNAIRNCLVAIAAVFAVAGIASPWLFSAITGQTSLLNYWMAPCALTVFGGFAVYAGLKKRAFAAITAIFAAICFAGSGVAAQLFPAITESQSFETYATAMKNAPATTKVGVSTALGHWVDELTFQAERDPVELTDAQSIAEFFTHGAAIGVIPEQDFNQAVAQYPQLAQLKVLDKRMVSSHPLTPGYVLKRKGNLYDRTLLLISTNR